MTTVLVCDDAPLAREAVRRAVAGLPGVERVTAAGSGEEVLARFPLERPDLVLMDVRMPGIGGIEASRRLMGAHPEAHIVMLTMGEDPEGVARAVSAGARGFLAKDASHDGRPRLGLPTHASSGQPFAHASSRCAAFADRARIAGARRHEPRP